MKKALTLLLVLLTAVALFASGSSEKAGASSSKQELPSEPVREYPIKTEEPITLTYWTPLNGSVSRIISSYNENIALQKYMEEVGVRIEFIHPAVGQEQEQFNLMMASGELPDIIAAPGFYKGGVFQGLEDGVYMDLTDLIPIYAPDYYSVIQEQDAFRREVSNEEGRIPMFASYKVPGDPPFRRMVVKQENLDKIGETIPRTVEDYERIFEKFKAQGITPYLLDRSGVEEQFAALFGVYASEANGVTLLYKDENGKIHYSGLEDGFRSYLELMNSWYQKGYISKDFASTDGSQARVLFDTDKIGMLADAVVATYNRCQLQGFTAVSFPPVRSNPDQKLHYERNDATPKMSQYDSFCAISTSCKYPEITMRVMNYAYTEEGAELLNWGVEGVNWDYVNGQRVYNDNMLKNPKMDTETASYYYKMHFFPKLNYPDTQVHANLLKSAGALGIRMAYADEQNDSLWLLPNIQYTSDELNEVTRIQADLSTYVKEMILKFIVGAESFDNYDKFIATQKSLGAEKLISITQNAYDRYMQK